MKNGSRIFPSVDGEAHIFLAVKLDGLVQNLEGLCRCAPHCKKTTVVGPRLVGFIRGFAKDHLHLTGKTNAACTREVIRKGLSLTLLFLAPDDALIQVEPEGFIVPLPHITSPISFGSLPLPCPRAMSSHSCSRWVASSCTVSSSGMPPAAVPHRTGTTCPMGKI